MFTSALKRSGELIGGGSQARKSSGVNFKKSLKLKEAVSPRYSNGMGDDGGALAFLFVSKVEEFK